MSTSIWETPWQIDNLEGCSFYHTMDLPEIGEVAGTWDMRQTIGAYLGPCSLKGRSVLDLGSASGFLSFSAEQRGAARVVSFDLRDATRDLTLIPYAYQLADRAKRLAEADEYFRRWKRGYWLAHRLLRSRAQVHYGSIYDLPEELGTFDVVLLGQILVHLQNPIGALASASRRCGERLVIVESVLPTEEPIARLLAPVVNNESQSWWHLSMGMYRRYLRILGFAIEDVAQSRHLCHAYGAPQHLELSTITARRCANWQEAPSPEEVAALQARLTPPTPRRGPHHAGLLRRCVGRVMRTLRS